MIIKEKYYEYDTKYEATSYAKGSKDVIDVEIFNNYQDLVQWIWDTCLDGYCAKVYDYTNDIYTYYCYPDDVEGLDVYDPYDLYYLETDENGNFVHLGDLRENLKEDYDDEDDYDPNEYGATDYEARAYYSKNQSSRYGLAYSETFPNMDYDLDEWVWEMAQRGFYVEVYDYVDDDWRYYQWPENAEYMDLCCIEDIETDKRGNFLNIEDVGPK